MYICRKKWVFKLYPTKIKKSTTKNCPTLRKITSDRPIYFISVQRYVSYCCVTRLLQSGVEIVLKKIGNKPSGGQIVKSQEISVFYNALLLDKFKQLESSQKTKLYPDTYSLQILTLNASFAINER